MGTFVPFLMRCRRSFRTTLPSNASSSFQERAQTVIESYEALGRQARILQLNFKLEETESNPALVQLLGLCPLLAITTTAVYGFALGIATTLALGILIGRWLRVERATSLLLAVGTSLSGYFPLTVTLVHWFKRKRARALAGAGRKPDRAL